jgi:hypothetical protein
MKPIDMHVSERIGLFEIGLDKVTMKGVAILKEILVNLIKAISVLPVHLIEWSIIEESRLGDHRVVCWCVLLFVSLIVLVLHALVARVEKVEPQGVLAVLGGVFVEVIGRKHRLQAVSVVNHGWHCGFEVVPGS